MSIADDSKQPELPCEAGPALNSFGPACLLPVLSAMREGVVGVDGDLRIIGVNPAAERILGRDFVELAGSPVCTLYGDESCPSDQLAETLRSGEPILDFQTSIRLRSGGRGQVLIRSVPLEPRQGGSMGVALILGDVTEVTELRKRIRRRRRLGDIVGQDQRMQELFRLIEDVAASPASVLIRGESGTGKELVAKAIHNESNRASGPFVQVNCSALSESLLESELFGHAKGAFTGAIASRRGRFEEASGGTIFLDEIGDVSPVIQVKLLRVLQERVVERVGENQPRPVDVRVVSATNRDLAALLATGRMREDFFYRIKVVSLEIPPLRQRRQDIPLLVRHFLDRARATDEAAADVDISSAAMSTMMAHAWPGNVRELANAVEHALVLRRGGVIQPQHLPVEISRGGQAGLREVPLHSDQERDLILAALERAGWNRSRAARQLGIDRTTLWRKIREYRLQESS